MEFERQRLVLENSLRAPCKHRSQAFLRHFQMVGEIADGVESRAMRMTQKYRY